MKRLVWAGLLLLGASCEKTGAAPPATPTAAQRARAPASPAERLRQALELERTSQYDEARTAFSGLADSSVKGAAALGLARVEVISGRYDEAVQAARRARELDSALAREAAFTEASALRAKGDLEGAERVLQEPAKEPGARQARLLLGEILIERGQRDAAEPVLMTLIEDYNADRIVETDAEGLALVGRAAHLLRSPRDANDAFNAAESAGAKHLAMLLWRAELFLEKHDPGHAEEVVREALEVAPNHPDALIWLARVRLEQAYDFDDADRLARRALAVNPKHPSARTVLAGIALRDMELETAAHEVDLGLQGRPDDLELLSMRAAERFLADDVRGFGAATQAVLARNPGYSRVYQIVGEYAEWEHRYTDIVNMMEEAVRIDPGDANAHAALGLNLIRAGDEDAGVVSLRTAFDLDPFNVRVFNTLNLYEKAIQQDYVSVERGKFRIRYPKAEKDLLDRYVPELLQRAHAKMVGHYGLEPETPIGIELYATREHFAVRTSGLPRTAIQGVCFGRTLASMGLAEEKFNLGMTLWHELAHVFHIQLSKYHVPRWFTEGLAEYETLAERSEWSRELDPNLFEALRENRVPEVQAMSRAFTRAEQMSDVATAYYASSKILTMMVQEYGMPKMRGMLEGWGEGKRTPAIFDGVLGMTPSAFDAAFRQHTHKALGRYQKQFVPKLRAEPIDRVEAARKRAPNDPDVLLRLARAAWEAGDADQTAALLEKVLAARPDVPDAVYLAGQVALQRRQADVALGQAQRLVKLGHDGYWTQVMLGEALGAQKQTAGAKQALEAAHAFDPTQAEPLLALSRLARASGDVDAEIAVLSKLGKLEQHGAGLFARLFELLTLKGRTQEIVALGETALWADVSNFDV
ncbi:MAG TPA: tetratricopeptide repeat protein, partial [Polyangiaceae bacterium]